MIDFIAVQDGIYDWVVTKTAFPTFWANQNMPQQEKTYIMLNIQSLIRIARDYQTGADSTGKVTVRGNREFTLNIQSVGALGIQELETIRTSLQMEDSLQFLRTKSLVYVNDFAIGDITGLEATEFFERATMDILFRLGSTISFSPGVIENVSGTGTFKRPPKPDIIETFNVTTP